MKKIFFAVAILCAVSANAQVKSIHTVDTERMEFGIRKHTLPLAMMYNRPNDSQPIPLYNYHCEIDSKDNKALGYAVTIKVLSSDNIIIKQIIASGKSVRLIKQPGLIRLMDDNSIIADLVYDYDNGWCLNPYVRNLDGTPSQIDAYYYHLN